MHFSVQSSLNILFLCKFYLFIYFFNKPCCDFASQTRLENDCIWLSSTEDLLQKLSRFTFKVTSTIIWTNVKCKHTFSSTFLASRPHRDGVFVRRKLELFSKTLSQVDTFRKCHILVVAWTEETEIFKSDDVFLVMWPIQLKTNKMLDVAVLQLLRLLFSLIALLKIYGTLYNLQVAFFLSRRCYLAAETESKYKRLTAMTQGGAPYVLTRAKYKGV